MTDEDFVGPPAVDQLTFRELIQYKPFRNYLKHPVVATPNMAGNAFRLWVQREEGGGWAKKDYATYAEAYRGLRLRLPNCHDATIGSIITFFRPPKLKTKSGITMLPTPPGHRWCCLCRRPTVFDYFSEHHAFPGRFIPSYDIRCGICGHRGVSMPRYDSTAMWKL